MHSDFADQNGGYFCHTNQEHHNNMAKSREEIQDIALHAMDKENRRSKGERSGRPPTLAQDVAEMKRRDALSPEQKIKELSPADWERSLRQHLQTRESMLRHGMFSQRFLSWLFIKRKAELESYHRNGSPFQSMIPWLQEMQEVHMNL